MVINDIQKNLNAGPVKFFDHVLKFINTLPREIILLRRKKGKTFISPVIVINPPFAVAIAEKGVNGHQLDSADAKPFQISDNAFVRHAGKSAALMIGNVGMEPGIAANMGFINNRIFQTGKRMLISFPVVVIMNDNRLRNIRCTVQRAERQIFFGAVNVITENSLMPDKLSNQLAAIRIYQ